MARRSRKGAKDASVSGPIVGVTAGKPELEATREGTSTPMTGSGTGGGSVMGKVLTEASLLQSPKPTFLESPFGQRYVSSKPKAIISGDVLARGQVWAFSLRGYQDYGSPTNVVSGIDDGEKLLQDWYTLTRDMAKRSLKYKHLPTSLSDTDMLRYICDAYYFVVANLATLINLNRLPQFNAAFSVLAQYLPRYMARITRLWRRTSALSMPPFLKGHAVRNGQIVYMPGVLAPTFRMWSTEFLLASVSGGPDISAYTQLGTTRTMNDILGSTTYLDDWIGVLETVERWCEIGASAIATDFVAVKDLIDMSSDIVPGTFLPGLPPAENLPGVMTDPTLMNDLLRRAVFRKDIVGAGTDRWIIFPTGQMSQFGDRIPVVGFGQPTVYDYILLGAPKYGIFGDDLTALADDVDSAIRIPGTDFQMLDSWKAADSDIRSVFGSSASIYDEEIWYAPVGAVSNNLGAFDTNIAASIRGALLYDSLRIMHPWDKVRYVDRDAGWAGSWTRVVDEQSYNYIMYMEAQDLGENFAEFLGSSLGVPYFK